MSPLSKNDFPQQWITEGLKRCLKMIESFKADNQGYVSWKSLCTQFCLLDAPIPTQEELNEYLKDLLSKSHEGFISKEAFINVYQVVLNLLKVLVFRLL